MIELHKTLDGYVIKDGLRLILITDESELLNVLRAQPVETVPLDFERFEAALARQ